MKVFKLLYVCDGNTCRSPIAQALTGDLIASTGCDVNVEVDSAGIYANKDSKPFANAIKVMSGRGINIENFKSKILNKKLIEEADLILTMNRAQKIQVIDIYNENTEKVLTLTEAAGIARNFKRIIDDKVRTQNKRIKRPAYLTDVGMRLESLAGLGNMDSVLDETIDGKAFHNGADEASDCDDDIFDPYGGTVEDYEKCAELIENYVTDIIGFICSEE